MFKNKNETRTNTVLYNITNIRTNLKNLWVWTLAGIKYKTKKYKTY